MRKYSTCLVSLEHAPSDMQPAGNRLLLVEQLPQRQLDQTLQTHSARGFSRTLDHSNCCFHCAS